MMLVLDPWRGVRTTVSWIIQGRFNGLTITLDAVDKLIDGGACDIQRFQKLFGVIDKLMRKRRSRSKQISRLRQRRMLLIAVGEDRGFRVDAPIDRQLRIVPANAALVNGRVTGRDFIENLGVRLERHEAMREADRDENLLP